MPIKKQLTGPAPIVTFYSYKGGVGRSMAVLNVASLLASRGFRVLIVDFDLEAPGLSHLIGESALPGKKRAKKNETVTNLSDGVVELLSDAVLRGTQADLFAATIEDIAKKYSFSYQPPKGLKQQHPDARLSIMPAGRLDVGYSARLDALNLRELYCASGNPGKRLVLHFSELLKTCKLYDYILVDSRTGHSDEAGICTRDLADHRMVVSGLNTQNILGTALFLKNLKSALIREKKATREPDIILSPIPNGEDDEVAKREDDASKKFSEAWGRNLTLDLLIPYHPRLALSEEAYFPTITASPLRNAYVAIEARLLKSLNHTPKVCHGHFYSYVQHGQGAQALITLKTWIKLLRSPGKGESLGGYLPAQFLISDGSDTPTLKMLIRFDEGFEILNIMMTASQDGYGLIAIARRLHEINYEKALEIDRLLLASESLNAEMLSNYATFLKDQKFDSIAGEFFKRAEKEAPGNSLILRQYANFLTQRLKKHQEAEVLFRRAVRRQPNSAHVLCDFGQLLIVLGRADEAINPLRKAWQLYDKSEDSNTAEIAYSMWLATLLVGSVEVKWVQVFKYLVSERFLRDPWTFDGMLAEAEKKLKPADFKYAKALAEAFLDESKVPSLEKLVRWKKLEPLDPALLDADGTILEI